MAQPIIKGGSKRWRTKAKRQKTPHQTSPRPTTRIQLTSVRGVSSFRTRRGTIGSAKPVVITAGEVVEEFEFSYHGDSDLDFYLFSALGIGQSTILPFIEKVEEWSEDAKHRLIVAVGECGMAFDIEADDPYDLDVDFYHDMNLIELARVFVDEGLFGTLSCKLEYYIDYEAIAVDLAHDYTEILINGVFCVYRCV